MQDAVMFTSSNSRISPTTLLFSVHFLSCRRLVKRIYVPLPDEEARAGLIQHLMRKQGSGGGGIVEDVEKLNAVVKMTVGYSGSDLSAVRCTASVHYRPPFFSHSPHLCFFITSCLHLLIDSFIDRKSVV